MFLRRYNCDNLVVQFRSVASTASELRLNFHTNAYFVVPDITFPATHRVTFHKFCSVII